jgi:hypothetical protein
VVGFGLRRKWSQTPGVFLMRRGSGTNFGGWV